MDSQTIAEEGVKCQIYLLGTFRLKVGGREVKTDNWKSQKALLLLKTLLANQGVSVSKEWLLDHLWPNHPYDKAIRTFNTTVYYLRQALEPYSPDEQLIRHKNGRYRFYSDYGCWYDVEEFERLYKQAIACEQQDAVRALQLFLQAVELYRDDYLTEDEYVEWTTAAREHYLEMYIQALLKVVALHTKMGNVEEAIRLCEIVLSKDQLRGDAHEHLIYLLAIAGRVSAAANHYNAYRRMLSEELGLEPSFSFDQMMRGVGWGMRQAAASRHSAEREKLRLNVCNQSMFDAIVHARSNYQKLLGETSTVLRMHFAKELSNSAKEKLLSILGANLRSDDVVCCDDGRFALILLSQTNEGAADFVQKRLRNALKTHFPPLKAIDILPAEAYSPY